MRVIAVTLIAAVLATISSASLKVAMQPLGAKPLDNPCVQWVAGSVNEPTNPTGLFRAAYTWIMQDYNGQCSLQGDVFPCFASNATTWGHHNYDKSAMPYDFCRTVVGGQLVDAQNFYLPSKGPEAASFKWVPTTSGAKVPAGAIKFGNSVLARSASNPSGMCCGKGFTGWADSNSGTLGDVHFSIVKTAVKTSAYEVAVCDVTTTAAPTTASPPTPPPPPPTLPPNNKPYIRFGNTIPHSEHVSVTITQGNVSYTWNDYKFAEFSGWVEIFSNGFGEVTVYEYSGGQKGPLLLKREIPLTPGPLVVVTRGAWPPTHYNSVETIAASYVPIVTGAAVRLFNLSPDTVNANLIDVNTGATVATDVAYSLGSGWGPIAAQSASFKATDSASGASLATTTYTPPNAPFVFTLFLLGLQNATGSPFAPQMVPLVDAPEH